MHAVELYLLSSIYCTYAPKMCKLTMQDGNSATATAPMESTSASAMGSTTKPERDSFTMLGTLTPSSMGPGATPCGWWTGKRRSLALTSTARK